MGQWLWFGSGPLVITSSVALSAAPAAVADSWYVGKAGVYWGHGYGRGIQETLSHPELSARREEDEIDPTDLRPVPSTQ